VVPGSRFLFPCDQAIVATGLSVDPTLLDLPRARDGSLRLRGRSQALGGGLFAGGDAAGGEQNIVCAARDGRRAAREILAFLEGAAP
jgi:NADPH-dependent glutamate synthase beta subunit-like oxidoreductase